MATETGRYICHRHNGHSDCMRPTWQHAMASEWQAQQVNNPATFPTRSRRCVLCAVHALWASTQASQLRQQLHTTLQGYSQDRSVLCHSRHVQSSSTARAYHAPESQSLPTWAPGCECWCTVDKQGHYRQQNGKLLHHSSRCRGTDVTHSQRDQRPKSTHYSHSMLY